MSANHQLIFSGLLLISAVALANATPAEHTESTSTQSIRHLPRIKVSVDGDEQRGAAEYVLAPVLIEGDSLGSGTTVYTLGLPVIAASTRMIVPGTVVPGGSSYDYALMEVKLGQRKVLVRQNQTVSGQSLTLYDMINGPGPKITAAGDILFNATYFLSNPNSLDHGLFLVAQSSSVISKVVTDTDAAPDGNGQLDFTLSNQPDMAANGRKAFFASIHNAVGGLGDGSGLYSTVGGSFTRIVRTGQIPPSGTSFFSGFSYPTVNEQGEVGFIGFLNSGPIAIYKGSGSALTEIARIGQALVPDWPITALTPAEAVQINNQGVVAFRAEYDPPGTGVNPSAVFLSDGAAVQLLASQGQTPSVGSVTPVPNITRHVLLNNRGQVAFLGSDSFGQGGVFRAGLGELRSIARRGDPVPGTVSGTFTSIGSVFALNDRGDVVFRSAFQNGGQANSGLFLYTDGTGLLSPLVQQGTALAGGVVQTFDFLGNSANEFRSGFTSGLAPDGAVAFRFTLSNGQSGIATFSLPDSVFSDSFE